MSPLDPQTTNVQDEIAQITVKALLPNAKMKAIKSGDLEWLERLHEIERKYAKAN